MRCYLLTTFYFAVCAASAVAQTPAPVAVPAAAAAPAPRPLSEELTKLQGFWKCQSIVFDGEEKTANAKEREALTLVVKGPEYRMYCVSDPAKDLHLRLFTGEIALDAATHTFTVTVVGGHEKGKKVHGIYELTKDSFKTCFGPADQPRPDKFEAAKGSGRFVESWKVEAVKPAAAGLIKAAGAP